MKNISSFLIILSGIFWGSMGIFVRQFNQYGLASMEISGIRSFGAGVILTIALFVWNRKLLKIKLKDLWIFLGSGILSVLCFNFCYFKTITMTSMAVAAVLEYTSPIVVMLLSAVIFKEKLTVSKLAALVICFFGCVMVSGVIGSGGTLTPQGLLTGLGAGFAYALYTIFSRFGLERGYHPLTIVAYTFITSGLGIIPLCNADHVVSTLTSDGKLFLLAAAFALVSTVLPYFLYTNALEHVEGGRAAIMAATEPVAATLFGIFLFHEKLTFNSAVGMLCVLTALVIVNTATTKNQPVKSEIS